CFFAGYMIRFIVDEKKVIPDYIFAYTQSKTYSEWVAAIQRAAGQPNINAEEYKSLNIPIPPLEIQNQIVAIMDNAYTSKKQKEAEAKRLLDSIDDYLLGELGIELPEPEENTVKNRIFSRKLSDISGGRFDPYYYKYEFENLENTLKTGTYKTIKFLKLIEYISSGATPKKSEQDKYYTNDSTKGIPLLRVQNITAEGIKLDDVIFITPETHKQDLKRSQVFSGDLLITITGRIGSSAVVPCNFEANINQHSVIVRTNQKLVLNKYLAIYFNSYIGQKIAFRETTGGTRPALDYIALKSILIPIPHLEKQQEIAEHITKIRKEAKQLQEEAKRELEEAKITVEKMILGD
ncbi:MAG TPA: restriction endonuclease subunit S, partial [Allocoleopsis sp.]